MKKESVSFYKLAEEMMNEEYNSFTDEEAKKEYIKKSLKNYHKGKIKYFKEMFGERYKVDDEYRIPIEDKEIVKMAIRGYTSKYYKAVRDGKIASINDLVEYKKEIDKAINNTQYIDEELARNRVSEFYAITEYESKVVSERIYSKLNKLLESEIGNIKGKKTKSNRMILNDYDAKILIAYYEKMIISTTDKWNELIDLVSDLRFEDIEKVAKDKLEDNQHESSMLGERYNVNAKTSFQLLQKAIEIINNEANEVVEDNVKFNENSRRILDDMFSRRKHKTKKETREDRQ